MNPREKRMAITLGVLLAIAAMAGGYMLIYSPYVTKKEQIASLKKTIDEKTLKQDNYRKLALQVEGYRAKSLPSDPNAARLEYNRVISKLLTQAGAPPGFTINQKQDAGRTSIPLLPSADGNALVAAGKEKYAYGKVVSEIKLTKVDLRVLGEFLRAYHAVPLLHHISSMRITRKDDVGTTTARRTRDRSDPEQWKDLEVLITTEALILDGAEDRKGLLPIPKVETIRTMGGLAYASMSTTPDAGDWLALAHAAAKPPALSGINSREYAMLVGKDIFHGPLPPPVPDIVRGPDPPPPPKANIDRFIKLNEITRRGDGSAKFELRDQYNNLVYSGVLTPKGEKTAIEMVRTYFGPSGKAIHERQKLSDLVIQDEGNTASNYVFKVVAVDSVDGLILSGPPMDKDRKDAVKPVTAPVGGRGGFAGGNRGGFPTPGRLPAPKPNAALAGGWVSTLPANAETLYYLKNGSSLDSLKLKKLTPTEVMEIVRRNSASGLNPYLNADVALPAGEPVAELGGEK